MFKQNRIDFANAEKSSSRRAVGSPRRWCSSKSIRVRINGGGRRAATFCLVFLRML
jgi:hypothetical protein